MEHRRLSVHSDSSVEPMDISAKTTASSSAASDVNSSLALKSDASAGDLYEEHIRHYGHHRRSTDNDNDEEEDDDDDIDEDSRRHRRRASHKYDGLMHRENLRLKESNMIVRKKLRHCNNNNNNSCTEFGEKMARDESSDRNGIDLRRIKSDPKAEARYTCPICANVSGSQHEFTEHIRSHNMGADADAQNFTCKICFKVLSSASSLDRHILVHTGERPFNCKFCHVTFTTNGNMHRHIRTHTQRGDTINGKSTGGSNNGSVNNQDMDAHYESEGASTDTSNSSHTNNNYSMTPDGKRKIAFEDTDEAAQKRKQRTINNNNINNNNHIMMGDTIMGPATSPLSSRLCCPACGRRDFSSMVQLEGHMDCEHPGIQAKCRFCEVVFKSHKALNGHKCSIIANRANVTQGFKDMTFVDFSSEKFPMIARSMCEQSMRMSVSSQKFECPQCARAFPCASSANIHARDCNARPPIGDCPREANTAADSDSASAKRQRVYSETSEEDAKRDDFFTQLDLQNKSSPTTSNHFSPPSRMDTSFASSSFSDGSSSQIKEPRTPTHHPKNQHNLLNSNAYDPKDLADIQSIISLTASSGGFMRQQLLEQSAATSSPISSKEPPIEYPREEEEAQDAFTAEFRKMKLRGEFPCKLCLAVFPNLRALKGHNRVHVTASGAGPYRCNMCPFTNIDKAALVRHMRTHNGDRPYECMMCNYAFTTKANCERHLRNRHFKTTREEVKSAIIYHPSEDSSCDDPVKKMQMYNSSYDDLDTSFTERCASPVSHLKEMLSPPDKSLKIQVKSMEQLIRPNMFVKSDPLPINEMSQLPPVNQAVDMSMDVLDLSSKKVQEPPRYASPAPKQPDEQRQDAEEEEEEEEEEPQIPPPMPHIDLAMFEKNQQMLMAQQQFLSETLPKIDPAHYFQLSQLYRNIMFPNGGFPLHPMFLQNSFLPPTAPPAPHPNDVHAKDALRVPPPLFPPSLLMNQLGSVLPPQTPAVQLHHQPPPHHHLQHQVPSARRDESPHRPNANQSPHQQPDIPKHILHHALHPQHHHQPILHHSPDSLSPYANGAHYMQQQQQPPSQQQQPSPVNSSHSSASAVTANHNNNGPVKMVIKNGVLMPKQKQRRYRTERPFSCEHCSARFTLRSNMERHIKQQHGQFWAQRQRGGSGNGMMRRGSSGSGASAMQSPGSAQSIPSTLTAISNQVKYAILSQQLKSRSDNKSDLDFFSNCRNINNNNNVSSNHNQVQMEPSGPFYNTQELQQYGLHIDREEDDNEEGEEEKEEEDDENEAELVIDEDSMPEDLSNKSPEPAPAPVVMPVVVNEAAKKVAETILEQAIRVAEKPIPVVEKPRFVLDTKLNQEEGDLVSVSKLVDNATNATTPFGGYFRQDGAQAELSDEEGLVASGSASDNNSGAEDPNPSQGKKKSAYSLAPNRVNCPFCQRTFPWTSSLRRHILTHTGQKPFKCSHCPLLFTTKSNCDRHLLRKHGNVTSAVSLYVPEEDLPEHMTGRMDEPDDADEDIAEPDDRSASVTPEPIQPEAVISSTPEPPNLAPKVPTPKPNGGMDLPAINSDLPFKCHLCDASFSDRITCLDHIKILHSADFALLMSKGAIETDVSSDHQQASAEDDDAKPESRGKYPDYANRKVMCAFCMRRFWSTEDLRRHMRTHSGERPFQCNTCQRKFTLKHSMLRHQKKHTYNAAASTDPNSGGNNSASEDMSDDEQAPAPVSAATQSAAAKLLKIPELIPKELSWKLQLDQKESFASHFFRAAAVAAAGTERDAVSGGARDDTSDLIGNLLGISDRGMLSQVLRSSAEEAAKLLGVQK